MAIVATTLGLAILLGPWISGLVRQLRGRAPRAHPLRGAGRDGRPPARLGAADPGPDPAPRRPPQQAAQPGPPPGARAAGLAVRRPHAGRRPRPRWPPRSRRWPTEVEDRPRRAGRRRGRWATARSTTRLEALVAALREAVVNAARHSGARRRCRSTSRSSRTAGRRRSSATGARASTPPRSPPTAAASPSRSSGAWHRHGGTAEVAQRAGRGHRGRAARCRRPTGRRDVEHVTAAGTAAGVPGRRPRAVPDRRAGRAGRPRSRSWARRPRSRPPSRASARPAPDVVLLDVHLPGGGGRAVIEAVRAGAPRRACSSPCRCPTRPRT